MAQLYFRYATMNAGKSLDLLKVAFNYEEQGKKVLLFTASVDNRYGVGAITSRTGLQKEALTISRSTNICEIVEQRMPLDCILVDEAQFLEKHHVLQFARIANILDIPVIAYGLKNSFKNTLFRGSYYFLIFAQKIEEIKTVCWFCKKKATMVLKYKDGKPIYTGKLIEIGGNDMYLPVCSKCYYDPPEVIPSAR